MGVLRFTLVVAGGGMRPQAFEQIREWEVLPGVEQRIVLAPQDPGRRVTNIIHPLYLGLPVVVCAATADDLDTDFATVKKAGFTESRAAVRGLIYR